MKLLQQTGDAVANTLLKMGTQAAAKWLGPVRPARPDASARLLELIISVRYSARNGCSVYISRAVAG
jgi:hypothetical protein